jgi:hypothetical protein
MMITSTAEIAENAEKNTQETFGELCVLCGSMS